MNIGRPVVRMSLLGLGRVVGRRNVARLARFITNEVRLDGPNNMMMNGELLIQKEILLHSRIDASSPLIVFDVGANVGEWTSSLLDVAGSLGIACVQVHMFEPTLATRVTLARNMARRSEVRIIGGALSDRDGEGTLFVLADNAGVNSLHAGTISASRQERVPLMTLDSYCRSNGIPRVSYVKIDTEGHDMHVMEGAVGLLQTKAIGAMQFEYNHRWISSRRYLRDAFEFLGPLGYRIGKITRLGVEFYRAWDVELESFREGNYLACPEDCVDQFPQVSWWNG